MRIVAVKKNKPYPEMGATYLEWQIQDIPFPKKEGETFVVEVVREGKSE